MPKQFVKIWTDALDDDWFMGLTWTEVGIITRMFLQCKIVSDSGEICAKNVTTMSHILGGDRRTLSNFLHKCHTSNKFIEVADGEILRIRIKNYDEWQRLRATGKVKTTRSKRQKRVKNDTLAAQDKTRGDKTRIDKKRGEEILERWNAFASLLGLATILKLSARRMIGVSQRLKDDKFNLDDIFKKIKGSKFCQGENNRGWKVDFDFVFCSANNYLKILEGKYDQNRKRDPRKATDDLSKYDKFD